MEGVRPLVLEGDALGRNTEHEVVTNVGDFVVRVGSQGLVEGRKIHGACRRLSYPIGVSSPLFVSLHGSDAGEEGFVKRDADDPCP